jgi:transcriptional regulator with XRE-family HTH domain
MNDTKKPSPLVAFIKERLETVGWSQANLAQVADVSTGTVSNLLHGRSVPETSTIEKIADALGVDRARMFRLLAESQNEPVPMPKVDPGAAYLAQKITQLPPHLRDKALDAAGAVVDAFGELADESEGEEPVTELDRSILDAMELLKLESPEAYEPIRQILEQLDSQSGHRRRGKATLLA